MGAISYQCLSSLHWQKHLIDQCLFMDTSPWSFNAKRMGTISYQCLLGHKHVAFYAKPMGTIFNNVSPLTQALNRSIPQKWALSAINVYTDTINQPQSINPKPKGAISHQCLFMDTSTWSFNGKCMGTISYQCLLGHKHATINAKPMGVIFKDTITLLQ